MKQRWNNLFINTPFQGSVTNGVGGVTTFSSNQPAGTSMQLVANNGGTELKISGTVYGGVDAGVTYGFGEGFYNVDFTYKANVMPDGPGYKVDPQSVDNQGIITAQAGITGIVAGTAWKFFEQTPTGNPFLFVQDNHRLEPPNFGNVIYPEAALDLWAGRGWLTFNKEGSKSDGIQDWLFVGVPLPAGSWMGMVLLGGMGEHRCRASSSQPALGLSLNQATRLVR